MFWDRTIPAGSSWREYIGQKLGTARCVVVAWSSAAIISRFVIEEAEEGDRRGVLLPVLFEQVLPPLGLRSIQAADHSGWAGDVEAPEFVQFVTDLSRLIGFPPAILSIEDEEKPKRTERERLRLGAVAGQVGERQTKARDAEEDEERWLKHEGARRHREDSLRKQIEEKIRHLDYAVEQTYDGYVMNVNYSFDQNTVGGHHQRAPEVVVAPNEALLEAELGKRGSGSIFAILNDALPEGHRLDSLELRIPFDHQGQFVVLQSIRGNVAGPDGRERPLHRLLVRLSQL